MHEQVIRLEERVAHQEAAIEELTRQSLAQADLIARLQERVAELEGLVRDLSDRVGQEIEDAPPPHY